MILHVVGFVSIKWAELIRGRTIHYVCRVINSIKFLILF